MSEQLYFAACGQGYFFLVAVFGPVELFEVSEGDVATVDWFVVVVDD